MIQGCQPALTETFDHRHDRSIDQAQRQILVAFKQTPDPDVVGPLEFGDYDLPRLHIAQKCEEGAGLEPAGGQPFELDDNRGRDDDRLIGFREETRAGGVVWVGPVQGRVERTGIADQRQERGS